ncbi:hypothetical protein CEXT_690251 [Caerostris extrusa]|uniref:Uncharacterized protein n=1 Tax=Caerostris extrusa TaxID=172846 RepID=A0AAV4W7B3_CAEEX|nr:hypothetical protein CEXT_690251 [Caerostris extrusa]
MVSTLFEQALHYLSSGTCFPCSLSACDKANRRRNKQDTENFYLVSKVSVEKHKAVSYDYFFAFFFFLPYASGRAVHAGLQPPLGCRDPVSCQHREPNLHFEHAMFLNNTRACLGQLRERMGAENFSFKMLKVLTIFF